MKTKYGFVLALAAFFLARAECRAFAIYLTTENPVIQGEETAKGYENSWRLVSFSQDIMTSIQTGGGGPPTADTPQFSDFVIAKFLDKASVLALLNTAQGGPIGKVNVFLVRETAPIFVAYKIVLENVLISSIEHSSGDLNSLTPVDENVKFAFTKITWTYTPLDTATGKAGTPITRFWDLAKNSGG